MFQQRNLYSRRRCVKLASLSDGGGSCEEREVGNGTAH